MPLRRRPDLVETALITLFVGLCAFYAGQRFALGSLTASGGRPMTWGDVDGRTVLAELAGKYGPAKNSENHEEWIVRELLGTRREGTFVDIGASHYRENSNTYFLETALGWSGIAVDALDGFAADYAAHRPRTRFVTFFVADQSDETAKLFVNPEQTLVSSSDPEFTRRWGANLEARVVRTITMDDLLTGFGVERFDFLSMDIELAEPKALAGFAIRKYRPAVVCVEAHPEVRQQILDYFAKNGYVAIARYLRADTSNLWFKPLDELP
jgi:FkbM family methyltransferase